METLFLDRVSRSELKPGDCLVELPIEPIRADLFSITRDGTVSLGHHPSSLSGSESADAFQLTCAAWQAYLLVTAQPTWAPKRLLRSIWPVNLDDVLAMLLVDPATRPRVLALRSFDRLLREVSTGDSLGPLGYRGLEAMGGGKALVGAIANASRAPRLSRDSDRLDAARSRCRALMEAMLGADTLDPTAFVHNPPGIVVIRSNGASVLAECDGGGGADALYRLGFARVILVDRADNRGRRRCSVLQVSAFRVDSEGVLRPLPAIDWNQANLLEPGWGGRSTVGGGPRGGTSLSLDLLWEAFKLEVSAEVRVGAPE